MGGEEWALLCYSLLRQIVEDEQGVATVVTEPLTNRGLKRVRCILEK